MFCFGDAAAVLMLYGSESGKRKTAG